MRTFIISGALLFMLASCQTQQALQETASINKLEKVEFVSGKNILIDVRTPEEYEEGHLPKALNLDYWSDNFEKQIQYLDKERTYYIYCQAGNRSTEVTDQLKEAGFKNVVNLKDGYEEYKTL